MGYLKTLKEANDLLAQREPFTTGTLSARMDGNGNYMVFSYDEMIAGITESGQYNLNPNWFSQTTTKHLNIVKRAWGIR
jgi:hypothetical protein